MREPVRQIQFTCRACGSTGSCAVFQLREMMYGSRETFDYAECGHCGCLQICEIPADLGRHYPADFYSMQRREEPASVKGMKNALIRWYGRSAVLRPQSPIEQALRSLLPVPYDFAEYGDLLRASRLIGHDDPILDVGCGASPYRLASIRRCGFTRVEGIDPFIGADLEYFGIPVFKRTLDQHQGQYGLIMLHHSLEHMPDPLQALQRTAHLLRPGGTCLVRVPVTGTYFWRRFGVHWVELDAPRHLHLLSVESMRLMAQRAGLALVSTTFDSEPWEVAASIRYERDIPLLGTQSPTDGFTESEMAAFARQVADLNQQGDGGRACFLLQRSA